MNNIFKQLKNNEQGISLLLVILVLSSLIVTTTAISNIVLRVGRGITKVKQSEIAYFSAESAIEKALYQIEKNRSIGDIVSKGKLTDSNVTWSVTTEQDNENLQQITLKDGKSYQLELDFTGLILPSDLDITCSKDAKMVYLKKGEGQDKYEDCQSINIDSPGVLRIINETTEDNLMNISGADIPIGINVTAVGEYKNQKRKIRVSRKNWRIY